MIRVAARRPFVLAVLGVVAAGGVLNRGYVEPQAVAWNLSTTAGDRTLDETWIVGNDGRSDETITHVSVAETGVRLVATEHPTALKAKHSARVTVHLCITDCRHPRVGPMPIRVRVTRFGVPRTITLMDKGKDYDDAAMARDRAHY